MKAVFAPIGILAGLAAGFAAQKGFERIWAAFDEEDAPEVEDRVVSYPKLIAALALEGATFRLVKGMVDRGTRIGFASTTGVWPGEDNSAP
ncbi:MAG TPA: DUF4235 domain-containing protein [Solirubrobacterales bacterium]|nr:DUF4235 domain-containing protein [Solirubrobacterales bacterium]